jgi:hypothetical protein
MRGGAHPPISTTVFVASKRPISIVLLDRLGHAPALLRPMVVRHFLGREYDVSFLFLTIASYF